MFVIDRIWNFAITEKYFVKFAIFDNFSKYICLLYILVRIIIIIIIGYKCLRSCEFKKFIEQI